MSEASDLIERFERETGKRFDENDGNNAALAGLFGAVARMMDKSHHNARDDVAAGMLIRHRMAPEYAAEQRASALIAELLVGGMSPDAIGALFGRK